MNPLFSINDLRTPEGIERVLQQFRTALSQERPVKLPDLNSLAMQLAPILREQLQAGGSAPINLQSLLPIGFTGFPIVDTHANRLVLYSATNYSVGQTYFETDRQTWYVVSAASGVQTWTWAGGLYYATFANRPVDLGTSDAGFLYEVSDHLHICRWTGTAWIILDNDAGTFIDSAVALGTGWQVCDGTGTTYLAISGATLVQTAFTTPDEVMAPSGVYHKSIAAYTGTINAASAGTITGSTANATATNQAATTGITVDSHGVTQITSVAGANNFAFTAASDADHVVVDPGHNHTQDAHAHGVGTLVVDATGQPRNMGVLRYFRR